jgi:hypothetical protein
MGKDMQGEGGVGGRGRVSPFHNTTGQCFERLMIWKYEIYGPQVNLSPQLQKQVKLQDKTYLD